MSKQTITISWQQQKYIRLVNDQHLTNSVQRRADINGVQPRRADINDVQPRRADIKGVQPRREDIRAHP